MSQDRDDTPNVDAGEVVSSNSNRGSEFRSGIQTPGGLPEWLVNASVDDLIRPMLKAGKHRRRRFRHRQG